MSSARQPSRHCQLILSFFLSCKNQSRNSQSLRDPGSWINKAGAIIVENNCYDLPLQDHIPAPYQPDSSSNPSSTTSSTPSSPAPPLPSSATPPSPLHPSPQSARQQKQFNLTGAHAHTHTNFLDINLKNFHLGGWHQQLCVLASKGNKRSKVSLLVFEEQDQYIFHNRKKIRIALYKISFNCHCDLYNKPKTDTTLSVHNTLYIEAKAVKWLFFLS